MNTKIIVRKKSVYGVERVYVVSEHAASIFAISKEKTLSNEAIKALKELGFTFEVEADSI